MRQKSQQDVNNCLIAYLLQEIGHEVYVPDDVFEGTWVPPGVLTIKREEEGKLLTFPSNEQTYLTGRGTAYFMGSCEDNNGQKEAK